MGPNFFRPGVRLVYLLGLDSMSNVCPRIYWRLLLLSTEGATY